VKKLLSLVLSLAAIGFIAAPAEAKANEAPAAMTNITGNSTALLQRRGRGRWSNRRVRVVTQSRLVRVGRRVYRETYQVRYLPNGRTQTRLISRVRVR
jgi:hypothetical protein